MSVSLCMSLFDTLSQATLSSLSVLVTFCHSVYVCRCLTLSLSVSHLSLSVTLGMSLFDHDTICVFATLSVFVTVFSLSVSQRTLFGLTVLVTFCQSDSVHQYLTLTLSVSLVTVWKWHFEVYVSHFLCLSLLSVYVTVWHWCVVTMSLFVCLSL